MIGERLKEIRTMKHLSQQELAKILNISKSYMSELESNKSSPGSEILSSINTKLGININWLLTGCGEPLLYGKKIIYQDIHALMEAFRCYLYNVNSVIENNNIDLSFKKKIELSFFIFQQDYRNKIVKFDDLNQLIQDFKLNDKFKKSFEEKVLQLYNLINRLN